MMPEVATQVSMPQDVMQQDDVPQHDMDPSLATQELGNSVQAAMEVLNTAFYEVDHGRRSLARDNVELQQQYTELRAELAQYKKTTEGSHAVLMEEKDLDEMGDDDADVEPPRFPPEKVNKMLQARKDMIKELYLLSSK